MDIVSVPTKDQDESNQRRFGRVIGVAIRASCEQYVCMGMSFSLMNISGTRDLHTFVTCTDKTASISKASLLHCSFSFPHIHTPMTIGNYERINILHCASCSHIT